jgi:hypothetical protein
MANTFELIASSTVGSGGAATIDFTSIPSTFTDLVIKISARSDAAGTESEHIYVTFNGSASAQYSMLRLRGTGSAASSYSEASQTSINFFNAVDAAAATANTFSNNELYIPNYAGSTNKSVSFDSVQENNGTTANAVLFAGLWSNTAAINRVTLASSGSNKFVQYSTAYLYGVKNA